LPREVGVELLNINGFEMVLLILVGLFIFGPDRLPRAISDGVRMLRNLREMARNATGDLSRELGTDIQLEDLHPKTFLRKHLLSEADEKALRKPFEQLYGDLRADADSLARAADVAGATAPAAPPIVPSGETGQSVARVRSYDDDAT
jgi:sec-independent protein translocase protein TatB